MQFKMINTGNSLAVQWLGLCASTAGGNGSIPGRGTKIQHASQWPKKTKKNYKYCYPNMIEIAILKAIMFQI